MRERVTERQGLKLLVCSYAQRRVRTSIKDSSVVWRYPYIIFFSVPQPLSRLTLLAAYTILISIYHTSHSCSSYVCIIGPYAD